MMAATPEAVTRARAVAYDWGSTSAERALSYPCDKYLPDADEAYFRAVDVNAPPAILFRWLCQLKVAPYSYDWLDNGGRPSPRSLTPGLEKLQQGQRMVGMFKLVEFEENRHLTLLMDSAKAIALYGMIAGSYVVSPAGARGCRLVGKLLIRYPRRGVGSFMRWLLPWGDFVMMRKQFLTLKGLAEESARRARAG
jgi:hypothetical protein